MTSIRSDDVVDLCAPGAVPVVRLPAGFVLSHGDRSGVARIAPDMDAGRLTLRTSPRGVLDIKDPAASGSARRPSAALTAVQDEASGIGGAGVWRSGFA